MVYGTEEVGGSRWSTAQRRLVVVVGDHGTVELGVRWTMAWGYESILPKNIS